MSEIFRSRIAVLAIALFSSLSLPTESHGATLAATLQACALKIGLKIKNTSEAFKIVNAPAIESVGARAILNIVEPDSLNKEWIVEGVQISETHLELNHSLEYVPHSLYAKTHEYIDKSIASKEQVLFRLVALKRISPRTEKKLRELLGYVKSESQRLNTAAVHQVDFFYFAKNATRFFSFFDGSRISSEVHGRHLEVFGSLVKSLIIPSRGDYYSYWKELSKESLLLPTGEPLSMADFNLASPYPIYFFGVSKDGEVADGIFRDAERLFIHDEGHTFDTSRFGETLKEPLDSSPLSPKEIALMKKKIDENLNFIASVYRLIPKNASLREKHLITTTLFYALRENPKLSSFSESDLSLQEIYKKWDDKFTYYFVDVYTERLEKETDLGFYFGKEVPTKPEVYKALAELKSALILSLEK
jgi:hypothetical protein